MKQFFSPREIIFDPFFFQSPSCCFAGLLAIGWTKRKYICGYKQGKSITASFLIKIRFKINTLCSGYNYKRMV